MHDYKPDEREQLLARAESMNLDELAELAVAELDKLKAGKQAKQSNP